MKIRALSKELQEIAKTEINEMPNRLEEHLEIIRDWLSKQDHLKCRNDDQYLLAFLRGSKFNLQRTKEKLDSACTYKTLIPEWTKNMDPYLPIMQQALNLILMFPLPFPKWDPAAPRVVLVHFDDYDPDEVTFDTMMKVQTMSANVLLYGDDVVAVSGCILVWNFAGMKFKTIAQTTPVTLKKLAYVFKNVIPTRAKAMYFINVPTFCAHFVNFLRRFLSAKLNKRIQVYSTNNIEEMFKHIPKSIFPQEYGGDAGSCKDLRAEWKQTIESQRNMLLEEDNYYMDESLRPENSIDIESILGIEGSFRYLDLD